jgi:hypothetical protein
VPSPLARAIERQRTGADDFMRTLSTRVIYRRRCQLGKRFSAGDRIFRNAFDVTQRNFASSFAVLPHNSVTYTGLFLMKKKTKNVYRLRLFR